MLAADTTFQVAKAHLKAHGTEPGLLMTPEWWNDLTPKQKSAALIVLLLSGKSINPVQLSKDLITDRRLIYRYLHEFSAMGIPVVRVRRGRWTLKYFVTEEDLN